MRIHTLFRLSFLTACALGFGQMSQATNCSGVTEWDDNQHWWQFTVGDQHSYQGNMYECFNPAWCEEIPSSATGLQYGWNDLGVCDGGSGGGTGGGTDCGPVGHPGKGSMPQHALIGYWHNFANNSGCPFRLIDVPSYWDVINVAFADRADNGNLNFSLFEGSTSPSCPVQLNPCEFKSDIAELQAQGKIVNISLGGAEGRISMSSMTDEDNFVSTLTDLINEYGFNGVDVDYEGSSGIATGAPIVDHLISGLKRVNSNLGGDMFLSMAPESPFVHWGLIGPSGIWGSYIPIIDGLRSELDVLHTQLYNNGLMIPNTTEYCGNGTGGDQGSANGTVDNLVAAIKMLVEGFPTLNGGDFAPLQASKLAFGVPSGPASAGSGHHSTSVIEDAFDCITNNQSCNRIAMRTPQPNFRGVMTWSINWDSFDVANNNPGRVDFARLSTCMSNGNCGSGVNGNICGGSSGGGSSSGGGTCTAPAWVSTTAYNAGKVVSQNGFEYTANWWSLGSEPANNSGGPGSGRPWQPGLPCN